jgi:hypothetical protein
MEQLLIIAGASIFGVLGTAHLLFTFFTPKFETRDPSVGEAMRSTSPVLTRETTMWRAWIGFNASHSLGAILLPAVYIPLAIWHLEVIQHSLWFSALPVVVGSSYLALAKKYWFKAPLAGIALATACFLGAFVLIRT